MRFESDVLIRDIEWIRDEESILNVDSSFSTRQIYQLKIDALEAEFHEIQLSEPLTKRYDLSGIKGIFDESVLSLAAELEGQFAAFLTVKFESWNRRTWITHLYVNREFRGKGIGRKLVGEAVNYAKSSDARGVWLETQNFNYPAIQFYLKLGFQFCGFDRSLYDPALVPGETALYFSLEFSRT